MSNTELLTTKEAAKFLKVSTVTLEKWRWLNKGPDYVKVGRLVKCRPEALEAYLKKNTVSN